MNPSIDTVFNVDSESMGREECFKKVLKSSSFRYLWNMGEKLVVDYVIRNIDLIVNYGFDKMLSSKVISDICVSIMKSRSTPPFQRIIKESNFLALVEKYPMSNPNLSIQIECLYLSVLPFIIIDESNNFRSVFKSEAFIKRILLFQSTGDVFSFFSLLLTDPNRSTINFLKGSGFLKVLRTYMMSSNDLVSDISLSLFVKTLSTSLYSDAAMVLLEDDCLNKLVKSVLLDPRTQAFEFLRYTFQTANREYFFSKWKKIIPIIEIKNSDFCKIVLNSGVYTSCVDACMGLVISLYEHNHVYSIDIETITIHLAELFFKYRTNSFLHTTFMRLIQTLQKSKSITNDLVQKMQIVDPMINLFKERESNFSFSSWGQMRQIAKIINPYISSENRVIWDTVVICNIDKTDQIIKKNYGGRTLLLPKRLQSSWIVQILRILMILLFIFLIYTLVPGNE